MQSVERWCKEKLKEAKQLTLGKTLSSTVLPKDAVVPIVDGYSFAHLTKWMNVAGRHITSYLVDLLQRRGYAMNSTAHFETVRDVKENLCYLSLVDIAYAPFIERFQIFFEDALKYDITSGRPKLAAWIEELNKIDAYP
ncbi:unnamed protein product [Camellia sinensis]